jgi:predicted dehydrogenase
MGKAWADNLKSHPDTEIVGWVDVVDGAASRAADEKQVTPEYLGTSLADAIQKCAPDFVVDVTIPEAHADVTIAALKQGLPVIGEKPMADTMDRARAMVQASEESGKLYMVSQSRRYDPGLVAFRKVIAERLGHLGMLDVDFYIGAHFGGFRQVMDHVLLLDMAIHTFDEARFLGRADALWVYAEEFNPAWSWYRVDASAAAIFEMEDGLRFNYRGSWCAEGLPTSWDGDWRATGALGSATWRQNGEPEAEIVPHSTGFQTRGEHVREAQPEIDRGIRGSLSEFLNALRTGETPQGECHDNIRSLAMVFAAVESATRKERVSVRKVLEG